MKTIKTITLEEAKKAINAMEKEANKIGINFSFCIIDSMYNVLVHEKMDNARASSVNVSKAKAMTSLKLEFKTSDIAEIIREKNLKISDFAGNCKTTITGGIPLYEAEDVQDPSGAIGVSGGQIDEEVALIGMKAIGLVTREYLYKHK